jgi:hypothetical protein
VIDEPLPSKDSDGPGPQFWSSLFPYHALISYPKPSRLSVAYLSKKFPDQMQH